MNGIINKLSMRQRTHTVESSRSRSPKPHQHTILNPTKLQVFVKFKPPSANSHNESAIVVNGKNKDLFQEQQIDPNSGDPIQFVNQKQIRVESQLYANKVYKFDHVFHHSKTNAEVFDKACRGMIDEVTNNGGNGLVFVYGNTGTGKTYTMGLLGTLQEDSRGIVPDTLRYLFIRKRITSPLSIAFSEIYLDDVYDLLEYESEKKLTIRQDQLTKEPYIENQIKINVTSLQQAFQVVNIGLESRHIAEQRINKRSSRGHGIITITFQNSHKLCKLCFVDLAGSERVKESQSKGQTLNEAVRINSSLSALETLLMNIQQRTVRMYRSNKLTRLLQPYIEMGKIRLIVTSNYENVTPIQFAKRCKGIKFMEKDRSLFHRKDRSLSPRLTEQDKTKQKQKQMFQCISNLVALLCKISNTLQEFMANQIVHSSFTLSDILSIQQIECSINSRINYFEQFEENLLSSSASLDNRGQFEESKNFSNISDVKTKGETSPYSTSPLNKSQLDPQTSSFILPNHQEILSLLSKPSAFLKKVHEIGYSVIGSVKSLSDLSQYKNIYKKQLFTSEVKKALLQLKLQKYQDVIGYLLKLTWTSQGSGSGHGQQNKIVKHLKQMGIEVSSFIKNLATSVSISQFDKKPSTPGVKKKQTMKNLSRSKSRRKSNEKEQEQISSRRIQTQSAYVEQASPAIKRKGRLNNNNPAGIKGPNNMANSTITAMSKRTGEKQKRSENSPLNRGVYHKGHIYIDER